MIIFSLLFFIFALLSMRYKEKNKKRILIESFIFFIYGFLTILYFGANYFTGNGINETVVASLNLGLKDAGFAEYILVIISGLFSFFTLFVMAFFYYKRLNSVVAVKPKKIKAFMHNGFLIFAFLLHPAIRDFKHLYETITMEQADDFYEYYSVPNPKTATEDKKNLLFIYAESLEKTYFDNELFTDLTPNLNALIKDENGIEFTNIVQTTGSNYTIAGITSTQCGIPLFTTSGGNSMEGVEKFYQEAICLGDILKKSDYYLSYMQGANIRFAGKDKFFKTHGFDSVLGKEELFERLEDKSYVNGWGLYDDTIFDFGYEEFEKLSSNKKPFALFLMSLDTHHPNGHLSQSCSENLYENGTNEILNTVKCSDMLISKLIKKVKESKYADNTIIVLVSDHLAMRNTAIDQLELSSNRRNLFVIFDPTSDEYREFDNIGTPFDISATLLPFLGITTDVGLGRDLIQNSSIYEEFEDLNKKLNSWRDDILRFWKFPKISETIGVDHQKNYIYLGSSNYKYPLLFKVLDTHVEPYFEYNYSPKLYEQLGEFEKSDKFLWIDRCDLISYVFGTNSTSQMCIAQGTLGQNFKVEPIDQISSYKVADFSKIDVDENFSLKATLSNIDMLKRNGLEYNASVNEGIVFAKEGYPSFLKDIQGLSYPDEVGRWSDANLEPSVIFTFKEPLPKKFTLELFLGAYGKNVGKYVKVKIAKQVKRFVAKSHSAQKYVISFDNVMNADIIEIIPPAPTGKDENLEGSDYRKFGLHFIEMKINNDI
jgi:phosphoglycerol transferase